MKEAKKAFHEQVAENLIEQLKKGAAPWQKPWEPGDLLAVLPMNPTTDKRYRGINSLNLMSRAYTDPRWLTYKQAVSLGAQVRKGEKSTLVQYWKFTDENIKTDDNNNPVLNSEGNPIKEQVRLERPRVFYAAVFNAQQMDNLPELSIKAPDWDPLERAEHILQASNAVIRHGEADRAFYRPSTDSIHLPHKHQFPTPDRYYATALHELGHWTGHELRLNRDLAHPFGSEGYAKEELRAEIASMLLSGELGIGHDPG
ncbi:MAG: zincin-like metallopeptidase domain-containing protein, partial [Pseudomonadota bacterium]